MGFRFLCVISTAKKKKKKEFNAVRWTKKQFNISGEMKLILHIFRYFFYFVWCCYSADQNATKKVFSSFKAKNLFHFNNDASFVAFSTVFVHFCVFFYSIVGSSSSFLLPFSSLNFDLNFFKARVM